MGIKDLLGKGGDKVHSVHCKADGTIEVGTKSDVLPKIHFQNVEDAEENLEGVLDIVAHDDEGAAWSF